MRSYDDDADQSNAGRYGGRGKPGTRGRSHLPHAAATRTLEVELLPATDGLREAPDRLLATVRYGIDAPPAPPADGLAVSIPLRQLQRPEFTEVWISATPVVERRHGRFHCASNDDVLFGTCRLDEAAMGADALARKVYAELAHLLGKEGYPHLLRVWNYLYAINEEQDGLERYRQFCVGRHAALSALGGDLEQGLPAASGIGTQQRGVTVYFLAAREPGEPIENPRQVSAYHYPAQHSPRSPLFARAMFRQWRGTRYLFISGTASIVGHETVHVGDVRAQLAEAFCNIAALLDQAGRVARTDFTKSARALLKVYMRRADDFPAIQDEVRRRLGKSVPVVYLQADLCRRDLLVEIEGMYRHDVG